MDISRMSCLKIIFILLFPAGNDGVKLLNDDS